MVAIAAGLINQDVILWSILEKQISLLKRDSGLCLPLHKINGRQGSRSKKGQPLNPIRDANSDLEKRPATTRRDDKNIKSEAIRTSVSTENWYTNSST